MKELLNIKTIEEIPSVLRDTPLGYLIEYQNIGRSFDKYNNPFLLIATCMDYRIKLNIPDNFAFIIRTAGTNLRNCKFDISCAIAIGNIKHIALIGHNHCGMSNLSLKKELIIDGLLKHVGWNKIQAEDHFLQNQNGYQITDEANHSFKEASELMKPISWNSCNANDIQT